MRCEPGLVAPLQREPFRRVLLNLLDKAVKYGPERGTVRVTAAADATERVRITVEPRPSASSVVPTLRSTTAALRSSPRCLARLVGEPLNAALNSCYVVPNRSPTS